ncbi:MAG: hypothetical protein PF445_09810 [Melioribacteraceae bacterium]|jgi:hypothetical protein|nr:hypothetical protein [Melioribacteraceae bacterium]
MTKILSPSAAVKKYCLGCMCGSHIELRECGGGCSGELAPYRFGNKRVKLKDIKIRCIECSAGEISRVRNCTSPDCPLYPFRMAGNPNRKNIGNKNAFKNLKTKL